MDAIQASTARNMSMNGGSGWEIPPPYDPNRPNYCPPTTMLIFASIEQAANMGKTSVTLNVKKYNYQSFKQSLMNYGYTVFLPQGIIENRLGLNYNPDDPNLIKYTHWETVIVTVSWQNAY